MIIDLNELGCSKAKDITTARWWNNKEHSLIENYTCAFENCRKLLKWFIKYFYSTLDPTTDFFDWIQNMQMLQADSIHLLKRFLLKFAWQHIDELWETLTERLKNMSEINEYRRCYQHHPTSIHGGDFMDGPVPLIKNCLVCQLSDWIIFS